jgi:hypothetical protein
MELIDVSAHIDSEGKMTPFGFTRKGIYYPVDSIGRRWEDENGQHILVMIPGGRTFEIFYASRERAWYLIPIGPGPIMA